MSKRTTNAWVGRGLSLAALAGLVLVSGVAGNGLLNARSEGSFGPLTLAELNAAAAAIDHPAIGRLPWQTNSGQDAYDARRAAFAADPEGYRVSLDATESASTQD